MRVHVISDVHGRTDALRRACDGADALICLGDLLLFLDYADHSRGIFADLFGAEAAREFIALRTAQQFAAAGEFSSRLWASLPGEPGATINAAVSAQYAELFDAMPTPAYLTYGNVDIPRLWADHVRARHQVLDGGRVDICVLTFGFVRGGLRSIYPTPNEINDDTIAAKINAVGSVDVLCAPMQPLVP